MTVKSGGPKIRQRSNNKATGIELREKRSVAQKIVQTRKTFNQEFENMRIPFYDGGLKELIKS